MNEKKKIFSRGGMVLVGDFDRLAAHPPAGPSMLSRCLVDPQQRQHPQYS